jgi:NAD(P)-dependent dehydrogenase (short-subunit alcohol dehydrogenase family)
MNRLKDKVAIVTGGASGIGRATAELFAEEGAKVVVADPHISECQELEAILVETDISNEDDCRRVCDEAVRTFGRLDILVNNAAIFVL